MGRTEGQDAVPMTVGQEFHAFGNQLDAEIKALAQCRSRFYVNKTWAQQLLAQELRHHQDMQKNARFTLQKLQANRSL